MRLLLALSLALAAPLVLAATAAPTATAPAAAAPVTYTHAAGSSLGFASSYDGESFEGRFRQFTTSIAFDPATATGRFDVVIALGSAGTENEERDEVLLGSEFFNAMAVPQARYQASAFRKLPDGRFVADGALTLRGITQPVPLTFRWTPGAAPKLDGTATVKRLDFNVGTGDWDDVEVMPDAVTVRTSLVLQPKR
jgi:polyisoprenoid-binding protein YceI